VGAVGTVEKVFLLPTRPTDFKLPLINMPGRLFYRLILEERAAHLLDEKVTARTEMKALCPLLYHIYLKRFYPDS